MNKDNVVILDVPTVLDVPAERVLSKAIEQNLEQAIVIGIKEGKLYFASTTADSAKTLLRIQQAKRYFLDIIGLEPL